jgi:uncharacterized protein (TIGR03437 family)
MRCLPWFVLLPLLAAAQPAVRLETREGAAGRMEAPFAFRAVAVAEGVRVRASGDGRRWSDWVTAAGDDPVVFFGEAQRYLETDRRTRAVFLDPGLTPPGKRSAPGRPPARAAEPPPIVPRAGWGCTPETCPRRENPVPTAVTHLIVHHTAGGNAAADWPAVVRAIWALHVYNNGWNDIGYNFLIDPDGVAYEGRGDGILGAHFSGVNTGTMGVALLGTYSSQPPAGAALATLERLLAWQAERWKLDAAAPALHAASGLRLNTISGHRDAGLSPRASGSTECPGNAAYGLLEKLRHSVPRLVEDPCPARLSEPNRCTGSGAATFEIGVQAACRRAVSSRAPWITVEDRGETLRVTVAENPGGRREGSIAIGARDFPVVQAGAGEGPLPCVAQGGITSAPGDRRPVAPGSLITLWGRFPPGAATLTVNGTPAPVLYADASQVNALLPAVNPGSARASLTIGGVRAPEQLFWVTEATPAVFVYDGNRAAATNGASAERNSPENPAAPGSVLVVYLTGVGTVHADGAARLAWSATIGGRDAGRLYLGATPGFPGLYQANLVVPAELSPGDHPVVLTVSGTPSEPAVVAVGR